MLSNSLYQGFLPTQAHVRALVWKCSPEYRRPRHFHSEPELNLIVSGSATFGVGETLVHVSKGELLGFPPGMDHVLLEASADFYLYAIGMDPEFSSEVLRSDRQCVAIPLRIRLTSNNFKAMVARCSTVVDRRGVDQPVAELWEEVNWLRERDLRTSNSRMHVLTRRTLAAVSDAPDLGVEPLAQKLRTSQSEISRHFHRDVGMTLVRYRTRLRLLRFIRLVDERASNLMVAAITAGFGSYS